MPSAYQKSGPAAPAQPTAGEAFNPGLTPGVFSLESDNHSKERPVHLLQLWIMPRGPGSILPDPRPLTPGPRR